MPLGSVRLELSEELNPMNYDAKQLLGMSRAQLDDLYRKTSAGTVPNGGFKGTFIVAPGTPLTSAAAELIRLMAWQGKVFDAKHGRVNNRVSPFGFESVPARVYVRRRGMYRPRLLGNVFHSSLGPR
jgi:hypothetical protein